MADDKKPVDGKALLKEIELLKANTAAGVDKRKDANKSAIADTVKTLAEKGKDLADLAEIASEVKVGEKYRGIKAGWAKVKDFYSRTIGRVIGPALRGYKKLWNVTDHKQRKYKITRALSRIGRIILLAFTVDFGLRGANIVVPSGIGGQNVEWVQNHVSYVVSEPAADLVKLGIWGLQKDTVYLSTPHAARNGDGFEIPGCVNYTKCDDSSALYYRAESRLMNNALKMALEGHPFYDPGQVIAPITSGAAPFAYEVTSYGTRFRAAKRFQIYPEVVRIKRIEMPTNVTPHFNDNASQKTAPIQAPAAKIANPAPGVSK